MGRAPAWMPQLLRGATDNGGMNTAKPRWKLKLELAALVLDLDEHVEIETGRMLSTVYVSSYPRVRVKRDIARRPRHFPPRCLERRLDVTASS